MCALGPLSITLPTSRRSAPNGRNVPLSDSCIAAISVLFDNFVGAAKADIRQSRRRLCRNTVSGAGVLLIGALRRLGDALFEKSYRGVSTCYGDASRTRQSESRCHQLRFPYHRAVSSDRERHRWLLRAQSILQSATACQRHP